MVRHAQIEGEANLWALGIDLGDASQMLKAAGTPGVGSANEAFVVILGSYALYDPLLFL